MGLFKKRQASPIPGLTDVECAEFLRRFGRERVMANFGPASESLGARIYPTYQAAMAAPPAFYDGLCRCAELASSGWAWVGASRVVAEVGIEGFDQNERYMAVVDRGLHFLRSRWISRSYVTGYENTVWNRLHPNESWFEPMPGRPVEGSPVRGLRDDEVREVAVLDGGNRFRVSRDPDGTYVGFMHRTTSSDDPTLVRDDEPANRANSVNELYGQIATGFGSPPMWVDPELEPFFVYDKPDFSD